eukprot:jgi/Mesvir1/5914/Mv00683-RA.1
MDSHHREQGEALLRSYMRESDVAKPPGPRKAIIMGLYAALSCSMLVINKGVVIAWPFPGHVAVVQSLLAVAIILACKKAGWVELSTYDPMKARLWAIPAAICIAPVVFSLHSLMYTNVHTIVVFRTVSTIAVAAGDRLFFSHKFSLMSMAGIATILCGSLIYAMHDIHFDAGGYLWALFYWGSVVTNCLYMKKVVDSPTTAELSHTERAYYQSLLSIIPLIILAVACESTVDGLAHLLGHSMYSTVLLVLSGILGLGICVIGSMCREELSATSFNVAGNMNKFITVVLSTVIWETVNTATAMFGLLLALTGGGLYLYSS